jgi:Xaa-Pro aminopeptidase
MSEQTVKLERIQGMLDRQGLDALLLRKEANFAWATCGATSHVNVADSHGAASLLYTPHGRYIITDNIEAPRLQEEEHLLEDGWEMRAARWYEADGVATELTQGMQVGADGAFPGAKDVEGEMKSLRSTLLPEELERFRQLGQLCAQAIDSAILSIRPGLTENVIAGMLAREAWMRGVEPIVNLVGTDERVAKYRHPLPTGKKLENYAMLVLCGRKWGLVASITRSIYFGRMPEELKNKSRALAQVDAHFIAATRPGAKLYEILQEGISCYQLYGFVDEWKSHHQGGLTGYAPREVFATPESEEVVSVGQAYAWNPSIVGTKSEDTILVGETENEILTAIPRWPAIKVNLRGQSIDRPLIMEIT